MMLYIVFSIACAAIYGSKWMLQTLSPKPNKAKIDMKKLIRDLKEQADELNSPSTFASYSKLNRRIQQMEKDLSAMPDTEASHDLYWVVVSMPYILSLLFIGRSYDMSIFGEETYWPIDKIIGLQTEKIYSFSLSAWYIISLIVIKSLLS